MAAIKWLSDRGFGRVPQIHELDGAVLHAHAHAIVEGRDERTERIIAAALTTEQLEQSVAIEERLEWARARLKQAPADLTAEHDLYHWMQKEAGTGMYAGIAMMTTADRRAHIDKLLAERERALAALKAPLLEAQVEELDDPAALAEDLDRLEDETLDEDEVLP